VVDHHDVPIAIRAAPWGDFAVPPAEHDFSGPSWIYRRLVREEVYGPVISPFVVAYAFCETANVPVTV
jgi:hypothetical protein